MESKKHSSEDVKKKKESKKRDKPSKKVDGEKRKSRDDKKKKEEKKKKLKNKVIAMESFPARHTQRISLKKRAALLQHSDPCLLFNVIKTNAYGKRQKRYVGFKRLASINLPL